MKTKEKFLEKIIGKQMGEDFKVTREVTKRYEAQVKEFAKVIEELQSQLTEVENRIEALRNEKENRKD